MKIVRHFAFLLSFIRYLGNLLRTGRYCHLAGRGSRRGSGGWSGWCPRRGFWVLLLCLTVSCCWTYIVLNDRATSAHERFPDFSPVPDTVAWSKPAPQGPVYDTRSTLSSAAWSKPSSQGQVYDTSWNVSEFGTTEKQEAIVNGTEEPLLTLFSTWTDRANLQQVRNFTLRNWRQLAPYVRPVLFTNDSALAQEAQGYGWHTLPISRSAVGVPVLKFLYMDAMARFNSTLYAFANGDILFTQSLVDSLLVILSDPRLPLDSRPLLVIGQRINVANITEPEASNFANITRMAKARGKLFIKMAEDFFITDRKFPWSDVPSVVIGRVAYDNWLVLNAIENNYVVVDVSQTALAVHQTTRAGNSEGHYHHNATHNHRLLTQLYKQIRYQRGGVDCAPWRTVQENDSMILVKPRTNRPKYCV